MYITLHCSKSTFLCPTSPQITDFRKVTENARNKEITERITHLPAQKDLASACAQLCTAGLRRDRPVISATSRTGKDLMSEFISDISGRASGLISRADGSSGHVPTSPHSAKTAFVFLVPFTCCQRMK